VVSHVQVTGPAGQLAQWQRIAERARANPEVVAAAPYVNGQAMLVHEATARGALVRGIDPELEGRVAEVGARMVAGRLDALRPGEFGIVLGADLARNLRVYPGDKVAVIAPQGLVTPAGVVPRLKQFRVVGLFEIGHFEYDSGLALVHIADAQRLYQLGDEVSGVRLKLADLFQARTVARELYRDLGEDVLISDWTRSHANFFRAVEIEKTMMFIILMLIVAVAAFNVVSTLVMAVTDKQADIAILRTLGATPVSVMQVFMVQGVVIGVVGTLLGVASGVALALNIDVVVPFLERLLKVQFLSKEVYFISELPSDLYASDVILIAAVALALSLLATIYPSWRASRVRPAEALRYE
jgi:lipoprotein-releasing system permease protein